MLGFTCVDLSSGEQTFCLAHVLDTNLGFIDIVSDVGLILRLFNISPQSWHQFHIVDMTLFPFELEVAIHGEEEGIQKPGKNI